MKDIGFTQNRGRLVEMNEDEYRQFILLRQSVEGNHEWIEYHSDVGYIDFNFSKVFEVIRSFYELNFKINEFQSLLDRIKESINK